MVTILILILGGVLLAAFAVIYFSGTNKATQKMTHTGPERGKLSRSFARVVLCDLRLVVQDNVR